MDFRIAVAMSSHGRLLRVFEALGRATSDRSMLADVAQEVVERTKARFETKTSPEGLPWKQWSDGYAATRTGGHSLLHDTGDLERGIEARVSGRTAAIGVDNAPYAVEVHKTRPFMGISPSDEREIMQMIENRAMEAIDVAA